MGSENKNRGAAGTRKPLEGVRIIDMSRLAPGPYCTMLLADLGAEVILDVYFSMTAPNQWEVAVFDQRLDRPGTVFLAVGAQLQHRGVGKVDAHARALQDVEGLTPPVLSTAGLSMSQLMALAFATRARAGS